MFSFMIDSSTSLGKQYAHFKGMVQTGNSRMILEYLQTAIGGLEKGSQEQMSKRNIYRMFVFTSKSFH